MTIDTAEIERLRGEWTAFPPVLALLDELEKAQEAALLHDSVLEGANRLQIENVDLQAELDKARAAAAWWKNAAGNTLKAEADRDSARALLRECAVEFESWHEAKAIRARIASELGDKP